MRLEHGRRLGISAGLCLAVSTSHAHSFGQVYTLPVPFWLYAWGAIAALVASFVVAGVFAQRAPRLDPAPTPYSLNTSPVWRAVRTPLKRLLQLLSVLSLLLCVATGLYGTVNPYANFNMTFFWIVFVLGFAYATALVGNVYAVINPWRVLAAVPARFFKRYCNGLAAYPHALGYWPAVLIYLGFIWLELFGETEPYRLSLWLLGYTVFNLLGAGFVGMRAWFKYCEFFSVFLALTARMAPVQYVRSAETGQRGTLRLRYPFAGLLEGEAERLSLVVFILAMLATTAYDGLHEAQSWVQLYWLNLYPNILTQYVGDNPFAVFPQLRQWYVWYQWAGLLLAPVLYLLVYLLFIRLTGWAGRSSLSTLALAKRFAFSLLPIALVYHITHYYTLIETQGVKILQLASDPFGRGWDLFGTADWYQRTIIPDTGTVWHVQVGLIVLGHVVSVIVAHFEALRTFENHRRAVVSQLPMLLLMVLFTTAGLWILSQPMQAG